MHIKVTLTLVVLMAFFNMVIGCHYYKVTAGSNSPSSITQYIENDKYFILHQRDQVWALHQVSNNVDENVLNGALDSLPEYHQYC
jgi:hypothetical protein